MQREGLPRPVVLVGLMGAGKSTVGPIVARRLGLPFVDADAALEARAGRTIPEIFQREGEAAFRRLEHEVLRSLLDAPGPTVIGGGGGVVLSEHNRALFEEREAAVVWLQADPAVLAARVGDGGGRPMLSTDTLAALQRLALERHEAYESAATHLVDAGRGTPEQVAEAVVRTLRGSRPEASKTVTVSLGERSYPVVVGAGALAQLGLLLPPGIRRVAVVTQPGIGIEPEISVEHRTFLIEDGEAAKSLVTVERLCRRWAQWGMSRSDAVVAVGGGVVTDVAGFAAAIYHRGIPVLHVPTTLLGQIDAAIGGKTGVNLPEGKNLLGAFWQPSAVICDTDTLIGLSERDYRAGLGELAKYHFLGGGQLDLADLPERVYRCASIKAEVVSGDEREGGRRAILNYGHTLAHALEIAGTFDLRHGEAVAIGLVFAAHLARALGRIDDARVMEHYRVLDAYGLDGALPASSDTEALIELMGRDKKALDGLTFVLERHDPAGDGSHVVELCPGIDPATVRAALRHMADRSVA